MTTKQCLVEPELQLGAPLRSGSVQVSVIIPALNEGRVIGRCLDALGRLDFARQAFEVILVDNGSKDNTLEIARSYAGRLNLSVLQQAGVTIAALRNYGASQARADVLAFLDADCLPPKNWLTDGRALVSAAGQAVIGGHYLIPADSTWVGKTWALQHGPTPQPAAVKYLPSGNLLLRRDHFETVGGFDETLETNEDAEFCRRARERGFTIQCYPQLAVEHLGTAQTLARFYRRQIWHGTHVWRAFVNNFPSRHNLKPVLLAAYVLLCLVGLALGSLDAIVFRRLTLLVASSIALLTVPLLLSLKLVISRRRWIYFLPLAVLYLTYGVARAGCLLKSANWLLSRWCSKQAVSSG